MITTDFLSTVSFRQHLNSLYSLTFGVLGLQNGKYSDLLIYDFQKYFGNTEKNISLFYNARSALYQYLISLDLNKSSRAEVILSGYNCVSVSNAIIQAGYIPIYADIEKDTLGIDIISLEKRITEKTGIIILQHSFGLPARNTEKIINLAKEKGIIVIEDVAHSLGSEINGKKLGLFGDAAIFSTGRDKVISSVNGAILLETKNPNKQAYITKEVPNSLVLRNHLYNILGFLAHKTYKIGPIGKIIMHISKKGKLFPDILTKNELLSNEKQLNYALPNSLAFLVYKELKNISTYENIRRQNSLIYNKYITTLSRESSNFRVVHICKNSKSYTKLLTFMKRHGILLGTSWSEKNIAPKSTNIEKSGYMSGSCPIAEDIASRLVFLPNSYNRKREEIEKVSKLLDKFYKDNV